MVIKNRLRVLSVISTIFFFVFSGCNLGNNDTSSSTSDLDSIVSTKYSNPTGNTRGCHDPKLFQDTDGTWYVYSTGWEDGVQLRHSDDLVNWTKQVASPLKDSESVSTTYGKMWWDDDFLNWEGFVPNDGNTAYSDDTEPNSWAPTVIKQNGKYYMFHAIIEDCETVGSKDRPAACITLAISDSATGPFIPATQYDSDTYSSSTLVRYVWTKDSDEYDEDEYDYSGCTNTASYDTSNATDEGSASWNYGFGAIDPEFVYDIATGDLKTYTIGSTTCYAMTYGSWKGGIALIYVDAETLKPVDQSSGDVLDAPLDSEEGNFGTLIAGGLGAAYEGSQLLYNSDTGYYYIFVSMGDLTYEYRVGVGRSTDITGPYTDTQGLNMKFDSSNNKSSYYHRYGGKIIGAAEFEDEYGWRCPGGESVFRGRDGTDEAGKIFLACHTRTTWSSTGNYYLQVRQMFFNSDNWPVLNPDEYYDESLEVLTLSDIAGTYDVIMTETGYATSSFTDYDGNEEGDYCTADANEVESVSMTIGSDGEISGDTYSGTLTLGDDGYTISIALTDTDGTSLGTFNGYVIKDAVDWARKGDVTRRTIAFTTVDNNSASGSWSEGQTEGQYFFGNKHNY